MRQYNTIKLILPLGVSLLGFSGPSGVLGPCPGLSLVSVLSRSRLSSQFSVLGSPATHAPGGHSRLALRLVWREFEENFWFLHVLGPRIRMFWRMRLNLFHTLKLKKIDTSLSCVCVYYWLILYLHNMYDIIYFFLTNHALFTKAMMVFSW